MNKQTAMDWFLENLKEYSTPSLIEIDWDEFNQLFEQAKEMEKEILMDAFDEGQEYEYQYHVNSTPKFNSETWYNEIYGGNK